MRAALAKLLRTATEAELVSIVMFDAGRDVPDGTAWLRALMNAFETGSFELVVG